MDGGSIFHIPLRTAIQLTLLVILGLTAPRIFAGQAKVNFNLPSDEFPKAILEFYHQSKIEVLFLANDTLSLIKTRPVFGELEPRDALRIMLKGTGLTFRFVTEHSVTIKQSPETEPPPTAGSGEQPPASTRSSRKRHQTTVYFDLDDKPPTEEVVVASEKETGSVIPLPGEPVISRNRADIDASGAVTIQDLAATLPQVWGGGPNEYSQIGAEARTNFTNGAGFNLRGLDAHEALVLVDGQRMPGSGTDGEYADVSMLPLFAIDHIEILADGANTELGADAVSGIVNYVTRDPTDAQSQVHIGGAAGGAPIEREIGQSFGAQWGGGEAGITFDYYDRGALSASARGQATSNLGPGANLSSPYGYPGNVIIGTQSWAVLSTAAARPIFGQEGSQNTYDQWTNTDILPEQKRTSVLARASTTLGGVRLWSRVWASTRHSTLNLFPGAEATIVLPSTNPGYAAPLGGSAPIGVQYGFGSLLGPLTGDERADSGSIAIGAQFDVGKWEIDTSLARALERDRLLDGNSVSQSALTAAVNSTDPTTTFDPFDPTANLAVLSSFRETLYQQTHYSLDTLRAGADRDLPSLPGGNLDFKVGTEYRRESLSSIQSEPAPAPIQSSGRTVGSGYAQLIVPLVGESNRMFLVDKMVAVFGERYEHYSDAGSVKSPAIKLSWSLLDNLTFRGTYSRSFHPSAMSDELETANLSAILQLANGQRALVANGGNADLRPETARTWTAGFDYTLASSTLLSATYFDIASTGRIVQPSFSLTLENFDGTLIQNPSNSQRMAICTHSLFLGGTVSQCEQSPVDLLVDARLQNLQALETSGLDVGAKYATAGWNVRVDATLILKYAEENSTLGMQNLLNAANYPVSVKGRASVSRSLRDFTATLAANYVGSYHNQIDGGTQRVGSWTTLDAQLRYRFAEGLWLHGLTLTAGARNLKNRSPPFVVNQQFGAGWDPDNGGNLAGRTIYGEIRQDW
jgi:iron complex outermembrane recepter protein